MAEGRSRYGLILKRPYKKLPQVPKPNVFADSSDEDEAVSSKPKKSQITMDTKMRSQFSMQIEKALEEDPNAFAYDEVYENMERSRSARKEDAKEKDGGKVEYEAREERKQQREREKEGNEFAEKEVFVTGAYRRKLEELEEHNKAMERMDRIDGLSLIFISIVTVLFFKEMMDVSKQKDLSGFYRHFLNDVAEPASVSKDSEVEAGESVVPKEPVTNKESKMKKKYRRRRSSSRSSDESESRHSDRKQGSSPSQSEDDEVNLHDIVSESKRAADQRRADRHKRFLTPSPTRSPAVVNGSETRYRNALVERRSFKSERREGRRLHEDTDQRKLNAESTKEGNNATSNSDVNVVKDDILGTLPPEVVKQQRLEKLRRIFAHRNDAAAIEEYRQRYLERKAKRVKNIAPKARIIKNVVVLGCSSMFYCGCIMPLRTYLSLSPDCGNVASIALSLLYVVSASSSLLYGTFVARQLTHKVTLLLTYVPFMLFIPGIIYYKHYVLLPAAIVIGLTQGPYFNALYAYLFNSAARFSYLSFETVCHSAHRFLCIFHLLTHCGWAWGFLLSAGTLHGIESTTNGTHMPWTLALSDRKGRHYQEGSKNVVNQITWSALGAVNPWYAFSLYFGWIGLSVLLTLLLLDRLQVHFYANKEKASARELLLANVHLMGNARLKRLIPLFICIGINEVFVVADVMQAYVACVSPQSTVGYVLFCYSLTNLFMSAFIHTAAFHVTRMTFLWVGFITQVGILLVMWLWVPSKDDQAVFYVIVMTWGFSHRIWRTFGERMLYEAFPDNWDSSFTIYHVGCTVGMSIGFLMKPFGKMEYKIYTVGFALVISMMTIVLSEPSKLKQRKQLDISVLDSSRIATKHFT
ncbi:hypothetical protein M514_03568 [Trichuris suis]|uniref:Nuclear speckle splicing regulatory protein 1 N-terminal domain-containing protein n=1 Tax=Trichuris suis TaxID=68888 RepID=A0A085NPC3_9BILA|nr:hypothetical protein M514_03568 [Trichuris suis]